MQPIQLINPELRKSSLAILAAILAATLIFASAPSALAVLHPLMQSVPCSASGEFGDPDDPQKGDPPGATPGDGPGDGHGDLAALDAIEDAGALHPEAFNAASGQGGAHCTNAPPPEP